MGNIGSDTAKTAKQTAKLIAKQIAREPVEMGKVVAKTVVGTEKPQTLEGRSDQKVSAEPITGEQKADLEAKKRSMMQALEAELEDIKKQKQLKEEETRQEEMEKQKQKIRSESSESPQISSKPSRKLGLTMKTHLQRLKKSTEIRMPPSG
jgi:hypothetical protein